MWICISIKITPFACRHNCWISQQNRLTNHNEAAQSLAAMRLDYVSSALKLWLSVHHRLVDKTGYSKTPVRKSGIPGSWNVSNSNDGIQRWNRFGRNQNLCAVCGGILNSETFFIVMPVVPVRFHTLYGAGNKFLDTRCPIPSANWVTRIIGSYCRPIFVWRSVPVTRVWLQPNNFRYNENKSNL